MNDEALVKAITEGLEARPEGLVEREIRQVVLRNTGLRRRPPEIRAALRQNKNLFVGPLADGRWRLKAVVETEEIVTADESPDSLRQERGEIVTPFVTHLPPLSAFIAFDLETTGVNPARDQIIQISAVRLVDGQPSAAATEEGEPLTAVFDEYVRLDGRSLPYGLKVKLGFADHPDWEAALQQADGLDQVLARFRHWVGSLPLVAHNARFDLGFLQPAAAAIGWHIPETVVIDTMELACLARPDLNSLRLEALAAELGIAAGQPGGEQVEAWARAEGADAFSWTGFHNAVVDVLVLAALVPRLVTVMQQRFGRQPELAWLLHQLLPHLADQLQLPLPTLDLPPDVIIRQLVGVTLPTAVSPPMTDLPFSPDGVRQQFANMVAARGLKQRQSQMEMVTAVSRALQNGRFMLIEAPTGTGKTFGYLVPGVLWAKSQGEPVVISTHTRLLQDQMAADLTRLAESLAVPFQAQVLKGMNNYLCLERAAAVFAQTDLSLLDDEERFAWLYLCSWLAASNDGLLDRLSFWTLNTFPILDQIKNSLRADRRECSPQHCAQCQLCFHRLAYDHAAQADIIVMNHALLLAKEWEQEGFPFTRVIVDEAHNLEDTATSAATEEVTTESLRYLVNRLLDQRTGQGLLIRLRDKIREGEGQRLIAVALNQRRLLKTLIADFGEQLKRYVEQNQAPVDPRYGAKLTLESNPEKANPVSWKPVQQARIRLTNTLYETGTAVRRLFDWLGENPLPVFQQETRNELYYLADKLAEEASLLNELLRVNYDRLARVHWLEVERALPYDETQAREAYAGPYRWAVKQAPVLVGPYLDAHLYQNKQTLVLTSATLRTTHEAGFGFLLERLGLKGRVQPEDALALPPELNYGRALFGIARYLRSDARPTEIQNFVDEVGQELSWLFRFTGGNGLGLFTARVRMEAVYQSIEPILGQQSIPVWRQETTSSRRLLLEEINARPGTVILGLKSFWEGVDVPGPNLCYVIMEKLPFPLLGEPIIRARAAEIRAREGHEFMDYILPLMLVNFKQGFGRLIRSESDIGVVLLLDKRVWNREYRRDLLAALPGMDGGGETAVVNAPQLIDDETALSRRAVYEAIVNHMAQAPAEWQIDLERLRAILDEIPEDLLTQLEQLLRDLLLPDVATISQLQALWQNVVRGLQELFQFPDWRVPEQEAVVRALLLGQDALVVLPTGSGKSFTFQLPALLRDGTTLVFSPLKALMKDQVDKLLDRGLSVADHIDSTQTAEAQERVYQRMREGSARLVYIAPERVRDPKLMAALRAAKNITQIVVDEAHCVHMWGQNFRPDFLYISRLVEAITAARGKRPPVAALTATATPRVREAIARRLQLRDDFVQIDKNPNRPELRLVVYNRTSPGFRIRSKRDKMRVLLRILKAADRQDESAIVYVNTTREAERLTRRLEAMALDVRYYHGRMDDQDRKDVQDMFIEGQIKLIVATKAFGMGVDKPDIRYVVHYQIPGDIESYYQEAGRAGRDGQVSWAILLFHKDDLWLHENFFIPQSLPDSEQVTAVWQWLQKAYRQTGSKVLYVDPRQMATDLAFDEDNQLGIHLHLLEELGYIRRDVDVTLKASTRLLRSPAQILQSLPQSVPDSLRQAFEQVLLEQEIGQLHRSECQIVAGAVAAGVGPLALDDLFYQLALRSQLIYRAFARAYTIYPGPNFQSTTPLNLESGEIARVRTEMEANLRAMRRYGESLRSGDCLRADTLGYLGYEKPATPTTDCCSLCDVNLAVPWANEPLWENLLDPGRYHDAKYAVLKAVAWNASLANTRGRAPYGAWKLAQILVGNDFQATRYEQDAARKKRQRELILASEHFGVLEGLQGGGQTVLDLMDELKQTDLIGEVERTWDGGGYIYLAPTEAGQERLQEGRLF